MFQDGALTDRVREELLRLITVEGRYSPGEKLPNEHEMAKSLGVSRATLREAVKVLAIQGYLDVIRGKGTYVAHSKNIEGGDGIQGLGSMRIKVKDLYEMRLIVEPQAAYYAAKRATDAEIAKIAEYCETNSRMICEKSPQWDMWEQRFHNSIALASHNRFMTIMLPIINSAIHSGVVLANEAPVVARNTLQDHQYVVEYLRERNAEGARAAMHLHIINTMRAFGVSLD